MGIYRSVLTVLVLFLVLPCPAEAAQRSTCLACHEPHHAERGSCVTCHRGNDRTDRKEIAHHGFIAGRFAHFTMKGSPVVERGQNLAGLLACHRCHTHGRKGSRLAANLDRLAAGIAPPAIFDSIKFPVWFMPNFQCDDVQIASLVNAVLEAADPGLRETAQVVHFEDEKRNRESSFVKQCGPCHRILSERYGGLGKGDMGPNLSGLLSEFYPKTYRDAESWTIEKLRKWLENPRDSRPHARMRPMRLTTGGFILLVETLSIDTKATR